MDKKSSRFTRIFSIIYVSFLILLSFDVVVPGASFSEIAIGFLIHNIPAFFLVVAIIVSRKNNLVASLIFIFVGLLYTYILMRSGSAVNMLILLLLISGPPILIGILYLIGRTGAKT